MTKHYREIKITPQEEMSVGVIASAIMQRVHSFIASGHDVLISLPDLEEKRPRSVGRVIRLHGDQETLALFTPPTGLEDAIKLSDVRIVPDDHELRVFKRVTVKGASSYRRMAHRAQAKGLPTEHFENGVGRRIENAYFNIASKTTAQKFKLFVENVAPSAGDVCNAGRGYGLGAAVPVF